MSTNKNKSETKASKLEIVKSLAWLIEAAGRGFVGYLLLTTHSNYVILAVAIYFVLTALMIVTVHFVNAHKQ